MVTSLKAMLQTLILGSLGLLCGCAGLSADRYLENKRDFMIKQDTPPAYVAGYIDGCSSGRRLGTDKRFSYRKDTVRNERDALYARGWQEGHIHCRNEVLIEQQQRPNGNAAATQNIEEARNQRVQAESRAAETEIQEIWDELKK
jgi:hypothetical protein